MTIVSGYGLQKGRETMYWVSEVQINLLPKEKIENVIKCENVEKLVGNMLALI